MANNDFPFAVDNNGNLISRDTYKRDYSLTLAYALEEAYKQDNKSFDTLTAFSAHTIAAMIEASLIRIGNSFDKMGNHPDFKDSFFGCKSSTEWMLWNIESAIMAHSGIDDEFFDNYCPLITEHTDAIITAHPELREDEHESHWFED